MIEVVFSGLEPRLLTRFDCRRYAREAYDLGVRYIGGCCGFEPYHIREIAEEVSLEQFVQEQRVSHLVVQCGVYGTTEITISRSLQTNITVCH